MQPARRAKRGRWHAQQVVVDPDGLTGNPKICVEEPARTIDRHNKALSRDRLTFDYAQEFLMIEDSNPECGSVQ